MKELRENGTIKVNIDGLKINYCLNTGKINLLVSMFNDFFKVIGMVDGKCVTD